MGIKFIVSNSVVIILLFTSVSSLTDKSLKHRFSSKLKVPKFINFFITSYAKILVSTGSSSLTDKY